MAKVLQSPLLGYNNNVRHKNRVFHIQTEDSGIKHPHIITHLFMDGGRILKSVKKSYAEHVGTDNVSDTVRAMMKEQHKAMFIALRDGQFDHLVDEPGASGAPNQEPAARTAPEVALSAIPAATSLPVPGASAPPATSPSPPAASVASGAPAAAAASPAPAAAAKKHGPDVDEGKTEPQPPVAISPAPAVVAPRIVIAPDSEAVPSTTRQPQPELTLDVDAIERAARAPASAPLFQSNDLPPPPKTLFNKGRGQGTYRNVGAAAAAPEDLKCPSMPAAKPARSPSQPARSAPMPARSQPSAPAASRQGAHASRNPAAPAAAAARPGEGRYAPARPAAIFGQARPQQGSSIFGEDLISDKSLDEVILSYLAEDLEPPPKKK